MHRCRACRHPHVHAIICLPHGYAVHKSALAIKQGVYGDAYLFMGVRYVFVLQLRHLLWATSKHDVYTTSEACIMHWSTVTQKATKVCVLQPPHCVLTGGLQLRTGFIDPIKDRPAASCRMSVFRMSAGAGLWRQQQAPTMKRLECAS